MTDRTTSPTQHVELRGQTFAYTDAGVGPVVLDAHGLSASRANNRRLGMGDYAVVAAAGRRLISYDARGHGESTGSSDPQDYTWAALAGDLLALADHFSPAEPVSAIGLSMGTGTVLHAVTQRPDRFDRLVLSAPPTAYATRAGQTEMYGAMAAMVESSDPSALAAMFDVAPVPPLFADVEGFPAPPDIRFEVLPTVFRGAGMADLPPRDVLSAVRQPTLVLAWAGDPGHPVSTAELIAETLPDAELHVSDTFADVLGWGERAAEFLRVQPGSGEVVG